MYFFNFVLVGKRHGRYLRLQRCPSRDAPRCTSSCYYPGLHVWRKTARERFVGFHSMQHFPCRNYNIISRVQHKYIYFNSLPTLQQENGRTCKQSATQKRESLALWMHRRKTCHLSMSARSSGTMETWRIESFVMTRGCTSGKYESQHSKCIVYNSKWNFSRGTVGRLECTCLKTHCLCTISWLTKYTYSNIYLMILC